MYEMIISKVFKFMNDYRKLKPKRTSEIIEIKRVFYM